MNSAKKMDKQARDARIAELREGIRRWFPAEPYRGKITRSDGQWLPELTEENAILDDEKFLYEALNGRKWTDVPHEVLRTEPDGYVLLTENAFRAFIAAWLTYSLDDIDGENEVRDFVVYAFTPRHGKIPDTTELVVHRLQSLSPEQRGILRSLLAEFAELDPSSFQRKLALDAVALVDSLG